MKNFKFCAISLNMLHTGGLCGVLRFTAPLSTGPLLHEQSLKNSEVNIF